MKGTMKFFAKQRGFDSFIGHNVAINGCDELILNQDSSTVIAGQLAGGSILGKDGTVETDLEISGSVILAGDILVGSLTVSGSLTVDGTIRAPKALIVKQSGHIIAKSIEYTTIVVESNAKVEGRLVPITST